MRPRSSWPAPAAPCSCSSGPATVGGGTRTAELTLPGYRHDVCSAIHPLGVGSPFLRALPLADHGLELIEPEVQAAHPLDGGRAAVLERSIEATAAGLAAATARPTPG